MYENEIEHEIKLVATAVANYFGFTFDDICINTRIQNIKEVRQWAQKLAYENVPNASLAQVGTTIGKKDHATVINARKHINNLIDTDSAYQANYEVLKRLLNKELYKYTIGNKNASIALKITITGNHRFVRRKFHQILKVVEAGRKLKTYEISKVGTIRQKRTIATTDENFIYYNTFAQFDVELTR